MTSTRAFLKQSKASNLLARFVASVKRDCWLVPGLAVWLLVSILFVSTSYFGVTCTLFEYMNHLQPTPYLDEVFHIPQAQKYCDGNFTEWDSKITTPPGLYLLTVGFLKPISWFFAKPQICSSVYALRGINMFLSTALLYVVYSLQRHLHTPKDEVDIIRSLLTAVNLCIFPVLYFFNFLYYTDVMSTFLVLFTYLLCLHERHGLSAFTGCLAVIVRQTNVVWVMFFGLLTLAEVLKENAYINKKKFTVPIIRSYKYLEILWMNSCQVALVNSSAGKALVLNMVHKLSGFLSVGAGFILFVLWNGSIVVGDKQAHQASLHVAQVLYFSAFVLFFMLPIAIPYVFSLHHMLRRRILHAFVAFLAVLAVIHFNTTAHAYLLADNRHYTFYIWRRIIDYEWWSRYMITPAYMLGGFLIASILKRTDFVFQIGFVFCLVANIVPQSLLEFRYFIIPYMLLRLQVVKPEMWQVIAESALYIFVNASTILMYSYKPIIWPDMTEPQRFLW